MVRGKSAWPGYKARWWDKYTLACTSLTGKIKLSGMLSERDEADSMIMPVLDTIFQVHTNTD